MFPFVPMQSRTVSLSSSSTSDESHFSEGTSASSCCTSFDEPIRHPYSVLSERVTQEADLSNLQYHDQGLQESWWAAKVSVEYKPIGIISSEVRGGSKKVAKKFAAQAVLSQIHCRE